MARSIIASCRILFRKSKRAQYQVPPSIRLTVPNQRLAPAPRSPTACPMRHVFLGHERTSARPCVVGGVRGDWREARLPRVGVLRVASTRGVQFGLLRRFARLFRREIAKL